MAREWAICMVIQEQGLSGTPNGALIARLEGAFEVFLTAGKNLRYQQNLSGRKLAIVELPSKRLPLLRPLLPRISAAVESISRGEYLQLAF